jgi:hypothetical protein
VFFGADRQKTLTLTLPGVPGEGIVKTSIAGVIVSGYHGKALVARRPQHAARNLHVREEGRIPLLLRLQGIAGAVQDERCGEGARRPREIPKKRAAMQAASTQPAE